MFSLNLRDLQSRKSAKKRSREEEAESDSGIDHEKTDKITNSGDKRQKKKRKKGQFDYLSS